MKIVTDSEHRHNEKQPPQIPSPICKSSLTNQNAQNEIEEMEQRR